MKVVRVQIDFTYEIPDALVEHYKGMDDAFFNQLKESFFGWDSKKDEPRKPIMFDYRSTVGDVENPESNAEVSSAEA